MSQEIVIGPSQIENVPAFLKSTFYTCKVLVDDQNMKFIFRKYRGYQIEQPDFTLPFESLRSVKYQTTFPTIAFYCDQLSEKPKHRVSGNGIDLEKLVGLIKQRRPDIPVEYFELTNDPEIPLKDRKRIVLAEKFLMTATAIKALVMLLPPVVAALVMLYHRFFSRW